MSESNHFVYKYVLDGEIIYIGKTDQALSKRLYLHGKPYDNIPMEYSKDLEDSKIYFCRLANATMSDVVESELIRRYQPRLNKKKMSEWSGLNFQEPNWQEYIPKEKTKLEDDNRDRLFEYLSSIESVKLFESERVEFKKTLKSFGCVGRCMGINTINKWLSNIAKVEYGVSSSREHHRGMNRDKTYWKIVSIKETSKENRNHHFWEVRALN